jgi:hypothetical protein
MQNVFNNLSGWLTFNFRLSTFNLIGMLAQTPELWGRRFPEGTCGS